MDTSTFIMTAPRETIAFGSWVEPVVTAVATLSGVGIAAIILIILARKGDLRSLVDALAKLITEPLAIWRAASRERAKNAQENARWRRRVRLARKVRRTPDLQQYIETVLALEKAADAEPVEPSTDAPPPRGPFNPPGEVIKLDERRARNCSRNQTDEPA